MKILVIDIGGSKVKALLQGQKTPQSFESGPTMTPAEMVKKVREITKDWKYDAISIGYPGPIKKHRCAMEPHNLAPGWVGFDFAGAFGRPVKMMNDAAMQALGSYRGGKMLFLGLGTGLGSAMVIDGIVAPMELSHLPYKRGEFEDYVGIRALKRLGKKKWRKLVNDVIARLVAALLPDEVVIGGGNVHKLKTLPPGCRRGNNANAFRGGLRLWEEAKNRGKPARTVPPRKR
jgi:polyphosphate glucokinase